MLTLYVTRHGQTDYNLQGRYAGGTDVPLNETGLRQARELSERLAGIAFDAAVSSPMTRARQTAEIILQDRADVPLELNDNFAERRCGELEGRTAEQIRERFPEVYENGYLRIPEYAPPWGESILDVDKRIAAGLSELMEKYDGKTLLLVTHGFAARAINRRLMGLDFSEMHEFTLPNGEYIIYGHL